MEATKTKFQALLSEIERMLEDVKNSYPKNYSAMIKRGMKYYVLIATVVVLINIIFASPYGIFLLYGIIYAPEIVILLYLLHKKFNKGNVKYADSSELERKICAAKDEFGEYPDVVNYLDKTSEGVQAIITEKKRITNVVVTISFVLILIATIFTLVRVINYDNKHSGYIDKFDAVLGINSNTPLARILPFKTEVADSIKLPTGKIDLFYESRWYTQLEIGTPNLIYADDYNYENDLYLLTITDQNGNPIPKLPVFYFDSFSERVSASLRYGGENETLQLFLSIKDNQDNLRYVVEKI